MSALKTEKKVESELAALLGEAFPGMKISVAHDSRWNRMAVTFLWSGFCDLLPEERFQRLQSHIPEGFREQKMGGFVWLELAPGETVEEFLRLPRSEDVADREAKIYGSLTQDGTLDDIRKAMRPSPQKACKGDFAFTQQVLSGKKSSPGRIRDAKLLFMRHGAYCDCQAIDTVAEQLEKKHGRGK